MLLAILLTIYGIMFILALIYIIGCLVAKRELSTRKKYQEHIDNLVDELFPPSVWTPTVQTRAIQTPDVQTAAIQAPAINEDLWRQEAKRNMVANIRTYFNQRKNDAEMPGPDELAPVNPYNKQTFPTPPSLQRLLE